MTFSHRTKSKEKKKKDKYLSAFYLNPRQIGLNWEQLSSSAGLDLCCVSWEDLSSVSPCLKASASGQLLHEINVIPDLSLRNTEKWLFRPFKLITQLKTCGKLSTSSLETTGSCKRFFLVFLQSWILLQCSCIICDSTQQPKQVSQQRAEGSSNIDQTVWKKCLRLTWRPLLQDVISLEN